MVRLGQKEVTNMKARRYELTDKEWELVRPLIPISHTGRPQKDTIASRPAAKRTCSEAGNVL